MTEEVTEQMTTGAFIPDDVQLLKPVPAFSDQEYDRRINALEVELDKANLDAFLAFTSSWFRVPGAVTYFCGYETLFGSAFFLYVPSLSGRYLIIDNFWDVIGRPEEKEREREEFHQVKDFGETIAKILPSDVRRLGIVNERLMPARTYHNLHQALSHVEIVDARQSLDAVREVKSEEELTMLRYTAAISDVAAKTFLNTCRPGVSERDVAAEVLYRARKAGADSFWTPICVAAGPRLVGMYPIPTRRIMQPGEIFFMDCGVKACGFHGDISRAGVLPGGESAQQKRLVQAVLEIQDRLIQTIRPGMQAGEVDRLGLNIATELGFGDAFRRGLGHGIGSDGHEYPEIPPRVDAEVVLKEGMVITLEPWLGQEGIGGAQVEDMILITPEGGERLTRSPRVKGL